MQRLARATRAIGRYFSNAAAENVSARTCGLQPRFFGADNLKIGSNEEIASREAARREKALRYGGSSALVYGDSLIIETELKYWIVDFVQAEEDLLVSDARKDAAQFKAFMAAYSRGDADPPERLPGRQSVDSGGLD
jgi:hypothetical protein